MNVSLHRELDPEEKRLLRDYLYTALHSDQYAARWNLNKRIAVVVDGQTYLTYGDSNVWAMSDPWLQMGRTRLDHFSKGKALAILICLSQLLGDDAEVATWVSNALSSYLIQEFNQLRKGLVVVADVPAEGLAFTKDNQLAALFGDTWYLGNGVEIDTAGEEWTRCTL